MSGPAASRALATACACAALACASASIRDREVPDSPIAFVYREEQIARERAEAFEEAKGDPAEADPRSAIENRGVVNLNTMREFLGERFGPREEHEFSGRLALLDPKTGEFRVVEGLRRGAVPLAWSADRRRLLFAQGDPGRLQLYEYDLDTLEVATKTHGPDAHPQGCYASDGRLVVAVHRKDIVPAWGTRPQLTSRIGLQSRTGAVELITSGPADGDPVCSPDGRSVAFVRALGHGTQIWIRELSEGAPARPLTPGIDPAFSPDGQWLVFSRDDDEKPTLWRVRVDGVGRTRMGAGAGFDEYGPAVSPDGALVVYESILDHRVRLYLRRFDGSGDAVLFASGDGSHAVW